MMGKTMKYLLISAFSILVLFQACVTAFDEQEEAAVYRSFINTYYIPDSLQSIRFENKPFTTIVISDRTSGYDVPFSYQEYIAKLMPRPEETTIKNFLDRNDGYYTQSQITEDMLRVVGRYPLNPYIRFKLPHILISDGEFDQLTKGGKWAEFYRRYPNSRGLVCLSRVGFNKQKTQALLYFVKQYDPEWAEGYLVLLAKKGEEWKRIAQVNVWMS